MSLPSTYMYESTIPPVSEDADGRALVADHEFLFHVMNASLEAQDVLKAMGLELRPRSISRFPFQQIFDELFLCRGRKRPAPNRGKHHWLRVIVRHSHLRY